MQDSRVRITQTVDLLRIVIRSRPLPGGRSMLTLLFSMAIGLSGLLFILAFTMAGQRALFLLFAALSAACNVPLFRFWLWYSFGEESIDVTSKGKSWDNITVRRHNGLHQTKIRSLPVRSGLELFANRADRWDWKEFREKGVLRLTAANHYSGNGNVSGAPVDFGAGLNEKDYEKVVTALNAVFRPVADEEKESRSEESNVVEVQEKETVAEASALPLPGLAKQLSGMHEQILSSFYAKHKRLKTSRPLFHRAAASGT